MITAEQLFAICPRLASDAARWVLALNPAMDWAEINTPKRAAAFIAQAAFESTEFRVLSENLNYSATALQKVFPTHFFAYEVAKYACRPESIANRVYANRLGNGDEASGDGWKYRGRGAFQITGVENYGAYSTSIYADDRVLETPDYLLDPNDGAMSAAWYWTTKDLNSLADDRDMLTITKKINGGTAGFDYRMAYYRKAISVLTS